MAMSQDAKDRTAKALAGKTIKSVRWEADPDGSNGYWVMTFDDDNNSEICWNRMQAEVAMAAVVIPTRPSTWGSGGNGGSGGAGGVVVIASSDTPASALVTPAPFTVSLSVTGAVQRTGRTAPGYESRVQKYRDTRTFEAAQWWDTDENREVFAAWFDEHDEMFSTLGHTLVLPDGEQAAEGDWIVLFPHGDFFALTVEEFDKCYQSEPPDDHVSYEREFGGESPELIHLRHAAHEFSEASSADVSAMRTVGRGAETANIRKPFVERMERADRALAAAAKAYAAVGDDPKPSDQ